MQPLPSLTCCGQPMRLTKDPFRGVMVYYDCYECGLTLPIQSYVDQLVDRLTR